MRAATAARQLRDIGRRIAELRVERGFTQEQLAEEVDLAARYVQAIEAGRENPTLTTLLELARALRVHPGDLFLVPRSRIVRPGRPPKRSRTSGR